MRPKKRPRKHRAPTRGHIANILGLKSVTPRSIAYIAVQVCPPKVFAFQRVTQLLQLRFSLSNASAWNEDDGCFNYATFYHNILHYFENPPGPTARLEIQELLLWWSQQVFGRNLSTGGSRPGASVSQLASQRAARELATRNHD